MKIYSITYDLKKPGRDYSGLYDAIKSYEDWCHPLESTWLVLTQHTASQIWGVIKRHIDQNDSVLIIEVKNDRAGQLPDETVRNWINAKLP